MSKILFEDEKFRVTFFQSQYKWLQLYDKRNEKWYIFPNHYEDHRLVRFEKIDGISRPILVDPKEFPEYLEKKLVHFMRIIRLL